jgi:hypothetical protein
MTALLILVNEMRGVKKPLRIDVVNLIRAYYWTPERL